MLSKQARCPTCCRVVVRSPTTTHAVRSGLHWATSIPAKPGRDTAGILEAAARGSLGALIVGGVDLDDLPDPAAARAAIDAAGFVVSLELRRTDVTDAADVVFPVAAAVEKAGTFLDWEGRSRPFEASLTDTGQLLDLEVLDALADALDVHLGLPDVRTARAELEALGTRPGGARQLRRSSLVRRQNSAQVGRSSRPGTS